MYRIRQIKIPIKTKNIEYELSYIKYSSTFAPKTAKRKGIPREKRWYGYYTEVFVAEYAGHFKGKVALIDKDKKIEDGRFYKIDKIWDELCEPHQVAIKSYLSKQEEGQWIKDK